MTTEQQLYAWKSYAMKLREALNEADKLYAADLQRSVCIRKALTLKAPEEPTEQKLHPISEY